MRGTVRTWRPPPAPACGWIPAPSRSSVVAPAFGTLLAKLIVTGASRAEALQRARRALPEFEVTGLATSLPLHRTLVAARGVRAADPARPFSVHRAGSSPLGRVRPTGRLKPAGTGAGYLLGRVNRLREGRDRGLAPRQQWRRLLPPLVGEEVTGLDLRQPAASFSRS